MNIKKVLIICCNILQLFIKLNLFRTIYFNFRVLPIRQALKFPFHFYGKVSFVNLSGKFEIVSDEIKFGMIVF